MKISSGILGSVALVFRLVVSILTRGKSRVERPAKNACGERQNFPTLREPPFPGRLRNTEICSAYPIFHCSLARLKAKREPPLFSVLTWGSRIALGAR